MPFSLVASPNMPLKRRLMSFWNIVTNSRKMVPLDLVISTCARVPKLSFHNEAFGSMIRPPIAPLFVCLIGSDGDRFDEPYSTAVGTPVLLGPVIMSPAYHW